MKTLGDLDIGTFRLLDARTLGFKDASAWKAALRYVLRTTQGPL